MRSSKDHNVLDEKILHFLVAENGTDNSRMTLVQWKKYVDRLIKEHGKKTIMYIAPGPMNCGLVLEKD